MGDAFLPGVLVMGAMYLGVFLVGVWASRHGPQDHGEKGVEELLLAGRSLPLWVGLLTMTATWVGGAYINGTAEKTYTSGVFWGGQGGLGYALSLVVAGFFFAGVMRRHRFTTMVDPFEDRFGRHIAALFLVPAVLAEVLWSASVLVALGTTFGTVMGVDLTASVLISAGIAIAYTMMGGLRSVAYTDVVQLVLITVGLLIAIPFVIDVAGGIGVVLAKAQEGMTFAKGVPEIISWSDWTVILILGGIPWNVYFQRVLAAKDESDAKLLSVWGGVLCALMALPPMALGLAAQAIDWSVLGATPAGIGLGGAEGVPAALAETPAQVLPFLLRLAVPTWVGVIGLAAVSAAVMASVDSSILSASALVAWNGYRRLFDPDADEVKITRIVRGLVLALGLFATYVALTVQSVAALWYLCGDIVYCVLFPQLLLALYDSRANRIGALSGFAVSVLLRASGGDQALGIPALAPWPLLDGFEFPFRTVAMFAGLIVSITVARMTGGIDPPQALRVR